MGFWFWGCLVLDDCSDCSNLSLAVRSIFPAPVEIPLSVFWVPVLWMSVRCVMLWQHLRLVTWWAVVENPFSQLQSRMRAGIWAPRSHSWPLSAKAIPKWLETDLLLIGCWLKSSAVLFDQRSQCFLLI